MFTGLIEEVGRIASISRHGGDFRLAVTSGLATAELVLGESIAVNGVCLTVAALEASSTWVANVSPETLARTNLGSLGAGDQVNLERAMRLGDRLGGHMVLGHVDGVGSIARMERRDNSTLVSIEAPAELMPYLVEKGSVAVDGISLTVNALSERGFELMIVPFTSQKVALLERPRGWRVNLEVDILGKYVARLLSAAGRLGQAPGSAGVTLDLLRRSGMAGDEDI